MSADGKKEEIVMAKKAKVSLNILYVIGTALIVLGFILPIFQFSFLGTHRLTGFDIVGDGDTELKIFALLIFIGGLAGLVLSFIKKVPNGKILKIAAVLLSFVGFVLVTVSILSSDGASIVKGLNLGKKALSVIFKSLYVGGYMIIAGWIVAATGLVSEK